MGFRNGLWLGLALLLTLALGAVQQVSAQGAQDRPEYVVRVDTGKVMGSQGGAFSVLQTGQVLREGDRIMLCEGARATIDYGDGCVVEYTLPGCYVVEPPCSVAALPYGGLRAAGILAGIGTLVAVIIGTGGRNGGGNPPLTPPISR